LSFEEHAHHEEKNVKREEVDLFEKVVGQLDGLHAEMSVMAKKDANDAVNAFKIKFINAIIIQLNVLLGDNYRPFVDFDQFSSEDLPSNSDVTFMLAQYLQASEKLRADNIYRHGSGEWYWKIPGEAETVKTRPPMKLHR
jgi:hypothetical protein